MLIQAKEKILGYNKSYIFTSQEGREAGLLLLAAFSLMRTTQNYNIIKIYDYNFPTTKH